MQKKMTVLMLVLFLLIGTAAAESPYWEDDLSRSSACKENRLGCQVLQMILLGHFSTYEADNSLDTRVLAAALPLLCGTTDEDFSHFCNEFSIEDATARTLYYIALGNCLWADILSTPQLDDNSAAARQVLLLFLDPSSESDGPAQIASIRKVITEESLQTIASTANLPLEFVRYLIMTPDWHIPHV